MRKSTGSVAGRMLFVIGYVTTKSREIERAKPELAVERRFQNTLRAVGFSYSSRETDHCEQPLVSLSQPPSSANDE